MYGFLYRLSFEIIPLTRMVADILCVKNVAKHILIENALILTDVS